MIKGQTSCKCGCGKDLGQKVIEVARNLAISLDCDIFVTSGARCWPHHKKIYDSLGKPVTKNSYHPLGQALDFKCVRKDGSLIPVGLVLDELRRMFGSQVWCYAISSFVAHADVRNFK